MSDPSIHPDNLRFASQVAHQMRAPMAAVKMMLRMLLGDFAGPLTASQKDVILRANERCDQALQSISRMLAIANSMAGESPEEAVADMGSLARQLVNDSQTQASATRISLVGDFAAESVLVRCLSDGLEEAIGALLDNAMKYTPEEGQVKVWLAVDRQAGEAALMVADSGVGSAEADRERVLPPFYRKSAARRSA